MPLLMDQIDQLGMERKPVSIFCAMSSWLEEACGYRLRVRRGRHPAAAGANGGDPPAD